MQSLCEAYTKLMQSLHPRISVLPMRAATIISNVFRSSIYFEFVLYSEIVWLRLSSIRLKNGFPICFWITESNFLLSNFFKMFFNMKWIRANSNQKQILLIIIAPSGFSWHPVYKTTLAGWPAGWPAGRPVRCFFHVFPQHVSRMCSPKPAGRKACFWANS